MIITERTYRFYRLDHAKHFIETLIDNHIKFNVDYMQIRGITAFPLVKVTASNEDHKALENTIKYISKTDDEE